MIEYHATILTRDERENVIALMFLLERGVVVIGKAQKMEIFLHVQFYHLKKMVLESVAPSWEEK